VRVSVSVRRYGKPLTKNARDMSKEAQTPQDPIARWEQLEKQKADAINEVTARQKSLVTAITTQFANQLKAAADTYVLLTSKLGVTDIWADDVLKENASRLGLGLGPAKAQRKAKGTAKTAGTSAPRIHYSVKAAVKNGNSTLKDIVASVQGVNAEWTEDEIKDTLTKYVGKWFVETGGKYSMK